MGRYRISREVGGDFPSLQDISPCALGGGDELALENNRWIVRITTEGSNQNEAANSAMAIARQKLTLFQALLAGSSTPFSIYPREDVGYVAQNLSENERTVHSNTVVVNVAGLSATANLLVANNVRPVLAKLQELYQSLADQTDCKIVLYYYGKAIAENDDLYKFLNYITAIEAMLSEGSETSEKISRRLAVLVSSKYENRQATFNKFKGYNDTRSKISHGGKVPELTTGSVNAVAEFARVAVRNYLLLRAQFSKDTLKGKLDRFFDSVELQAVKTATAF